MTPATVLALSGSHDLSTAVAVRSQILAAAGDGGSLRLDLSAVEAADISLVQIVLSLGKTLRSRGDALTVAASEPVQDLFRRAGATLPASN